jgi:hypothetical protein
MTAVGFLMGRGAGLAALEVSADNALEVASAAMNSECGLGTSFVEGGALDRLASVKGGAPAGFRSAAAAAAVAVARTCAAANNSECGLGTSFVEGGALDRLASVKGGAPTGFRSAVAEVTALQVTSAPHSASMLIGSIGALKLFVSTALPFPLSALVVVLSATLAFLTMAGSWSSSASLISSSLSDMTGFDFFAVRFFARLRGWLSLSDVFAFLDWWWRGGFVASAEDGLEEVISMTSCTGGRVKGTLGFFALIVSVWPLAKARRMTAGEPRPGGASTYNGI